MTDYMTRKEAAKYLRISYSTLGKWGSKSRLKRNLPFLKVGSKTLYKLDDLNYFLRDETRDKRPDL